MNNPKGQGAPRWGSESETFPSGYSDSIEVSLHFFLAHCLILKQSFYFCFFLLLPGLWHECGVYIVFCPPNLWFCYFQKHFDLVSAHFPAKLSLKNDCCGSGVHFVFCFQRGDFLLERWFHTFAVSACGGVTLRAKGGLNTTTKYVSVQQCYHTAQILRTKIISDPFW